MIEKRGSTRDEEGVRRRGSKAETLDRAAREKRGTESNALKMEKTGTRPAMGETIAAEIDAARDAA